MSVPVARNPAPQNPPPKNPAPKNFILNYLFTHEPENSLVDELRPVKMKLGTVLFEDDDAISDVFFPESCVTSIIRTAADGPMVEVGVIGFDGLVGVRGLTDDRHVNRGVIQHEGAMQKLSLDRFRREFKAGGAMQQIVLRTMMAFLAQVTQTALCNRLHTIEQRLARWLLMMRDRVESDAFSMTQEFLSHMLGTRIAGVNEAVRDLTLGGVIRHGRNLITIIDRDGLEDMSCECYAVVSEPFNH